MCRPWDWHSEGPPIPVGQERHSPRGAQLLARKEHLCLRGVRRGVKVVRDEEEQVVGRRRPPAGTQGLQRAGLGRPHTAARARPARVGLDNGDGRARGVHRVMVILLSLCVRGGRERERERERERGEKNKNNKKRRKIKRERERERKVVRKCVCVHPQERERGGGCREDTTRPLTSSWPSPRCSARGP